MDDLHEKERTPCVNFYFGMRFFRKRAQIYDNAGGDRPHDPRNSETLTCRRAYAASNKIRPGEDVREKSGCKRRSKDTAVLLLRGKGNDAGRNGMDFLQLFFSD